MNQWGWTALEAWLHEREQWPVGPVFCVIEGKTAGGQWDPSCARRAFRRLIAQVGIRKHISPHALRHGFTVESGRRGRLELVQRQLGHASLDHTVKYFAALDDSEVVEHFAQAPAPVMSVPNRR